MKVLTVTIAIPFVLLIAFVLASSCAVPTVGLDGGGLRPCPSSPNCVCSEGDTAAESAAIEPFRVPEGTSPDTAFTALMTVLGDGRARIEAEADGYVHAVFTTRILRFKDDFEARLDREGALIHVRSASRVGHSDLGKNRKRVEALRRAWRDALP